MPSRPVSARARSARGAHHISSRLLCPAPPRPSTHHTRPAICTECGFGARHLACCPISLGGTVRATNVPCVHACCPLPLQNVALGPDISRLAATLDGAAPGAPRLRAARCCRRRGRPRRGCRWLGCRRCCRRWERAPCRSSVQRCRAAAARSQTLRACGSRAPTRAARAGRCPARCSPRGRCSRVRGAAAGGGRGGGSGAGAAAGRPLLRASLPCPGAVAHPPPATCAPSLALACTAGAPAPDGPRRFVYEQADDPFSFAVTRVEPAEGAPRPGRTTWNTTGLRLVFKVGGQAGAAGTSLRRLAPCPCAAGSACSPHPDPFHPQPTTPSRSNAWS